MATKKGKNRIRHKKRERRNKFWIFFGRAVAVGIPVFILLSYLTYLPISKPIDPADTVTVTAKVSDIWFGEWSNFGKGSSDYHFIYLYTDQGKFRLTGNDDRESSTEYGNYNILALSEAIQNGDTITITYRKFYPWLMPKKEVLGLQEGDRVYRSLDVYNQRVEGTLLSNSIWTAVFILLTLPITLFALDVPFAIARKVSQKRHEEYLAAKKAAKEAKAAKQQKTAPD